MSIADAIARLNSAQNAESPEERIGHLIAAQDDLKESLKAARDSAHSTVPGQERLPYEASEPKATVEVVVGPDGLVQTPSDVNAEAMAEMANLPTMTQDEADALPFAEEGDTGEDLDETQSVHELAREQEHSDREADLAAARAGE